MGIDCWYTRLFAAVWRTRQSRVRTYWAETELDQIRRNMANMANLQKEGFGQKVILKGRNQTPEKHTREDGFGVTTYKGLIKCYDSWDFLSADVNLLVQLQIKWAKFLL